MNNKKLFFLIILTAFFNSCNNSNFKIISNENTVINKYSNIDEIYKEWINYNLNEISPWWEWDKMYNETKKRYLSDEREMFFSDEMKGISSKFSIKNNTNQIIETAKLTVVIKFTFETGKMFNYISPSRGYILNLGDKGWQKKEVLDFGPYYEIVKYSHDKTLSIHTPTKVEIQYYINASNSIGYSNYTGPKDIRYYWVDSSWQLGYFMEKNFSEENSIFGEKVFSKDITDIWNNPPKSSFEKNQTLNNGDLDKNFFDQKKEELISKGWKEEEVKNGDLPKCYNFIPTKGEVDNHLEVIVGGGTDVSIKVMDLETDKCIRYVFVNSGTQYKIKNIPKGRYYLKIAYGKDWLSKIEDGKCIGKFIKNPLYEKGEDILDFNIENNNDGSINIPSYQLSLDVISSGTSNSFNSQRISEEEFNN